MIYSRTARHSDIEDIGLDNLLKTYMGMIKKEGDYDSSPYKFWDYCLLIKLINEFYTDMVSVLNLTKGEVSDIVLENIFDNLALKDNKIIMLDQIGINDIIGTPVRNNKYDIVCCLGSLEHTLADYTKFIEKISKHVRMSGFIFITVDELSLDSHKFKILKIKDLLETSILLETLGYDFVSDEDDIIDYIDGSRAVSSLVMQRVGR